MENNFEKHIKDTMGNPPDFPFEERLWDDMESRLDKGKDRKPFLGFMGRLPLFLLALSAMSLAGFFYVKQYKAMQKVAEVEQQLANQQQKDKQANTNATPSIEKRVTVIYDTIYNRVVIDQIQNSGFRKQAAKTTYKPNMFAFNFRATESSTSNSNRSEIPSIFSYTSITDAFGRKGGINLLQRQKLKQEKEIATTKYFDTAIDELASIDYSFLDIDQEVRLPALNIIEKKRRKRLRVYLRELRPSYFAVSATAGTFASLNLGGSGFNLRGIAQAELGLGKRSGLVAGVEYFSNDFNKRIDPGEPEDYEGFPILPPGNAEDVLQRIQGDFTYLQIPFGIKHTIFPRRYFYPYISAGLIASQVKKSRLEYQYLSATTGEYFVSRSNLLPQTFELSAFWSTLGFEIQMNKNWSLLLEGSSQFDLKKGTFKYENLSILKLGTGLRYEF